MTSLYATNQLPPVMRESFEMECAMLTIHFQGAGKVVLLDGSATLFNAPLMRNVLYRFFKCGVPIEIPLRARLEIEGQFTVYPNILDSTVTDLHAILDAARADAALQLEARNQPPSATSTDRSGLTSQPPRLAKVPPGDALHTSAHAHALKSDDEVLLGPRVLVVGGRDTGKTSLCHSLVNLGTRAAECAVTFVDVDVGQQCITCPGSIAMAFMESYIPVEEAFNAVAPLSFFFGDYVVTTATRKRYLDLCACAAQAAASVGFAKPSFQCGGMIINTMGWTKDLGRDLLIELASIFAVTHIIVTGSDADLEEAIKSALLGRAVRLIRYTKRSLLMKRMESALADAQSQHLFSYFAGTARTPLSPARAVAKTTDVVFVSALTLDTLTWQDIKPCSVAAVVWADTLDSVGEANVAGYIILLEVGKRFFAFLAPATGNLPKPYLLVSSTIALAPEKIPPLSVS